MQSSSTRLQRDSVEPDGLLDTDEVLRAAMNDPAWHDMVAKLARPPKLVGRPEKYPLAALMLFGMAVHETSSLLRVERYFRRNWTWIRPHLAEHYCGYTGLDLGGEAPNHCDYRRYLRRHEVHGDRLNAAFEEWAMRLSTRTYAELAPEGTMTAPEICDTIVADGVHLPPLFRGDKPDEWDEETGELIRRRRRDPDASFHTTGDGRKVIGTKFVVASRYRGSQNSTLILAVRPEGRTGEAATAVDLVLETAARFPTVTAIGYDKALRGTHIDPILKHGLTPLVRPFDHSKDKNPTPYIETAHFSKTDREGHQSSMKLDLYACDGQASMKASVNGHPELVPLTLKKFSRNPNSDGSYRAYLDLSIPDDPRVMPDLVGATARIRADITAEDKARDFNRTEHLRVHGPDSPLFDWLMGRRNTAESSNKWLKRYLLDGNARGVGRDRQHADLTLAAAYRNLHVELAAAIQRRRSQLPTAA